MGVSTGNEEPWRADHGPAVADWPTRARAERLRQWPTLETLARRVAVDPELVGLLLLGSVAAGEGDALSDLDVVVVARSGRFPAAWERRERLREGAPLVAWDHLLSDRPDCGLVVWLTSDLVLVEALITTPGSARLAEGAPCVVVTGPPDLVARLPTRPRVRRAEMQITHPVEHAYKALQAAVRGVGATATPRRWEEGP